MPSYLQHFQAATESKLVSQYEWAKELATSYLILCSTPVSHRACCFEQAADQWCTECQCIAYVEHVTLMQPPSLQHCFQPCFIQRQVFYCFVTPVSLSLAWVPSAQCHLRCVLEALACT